MEIGTRGGAPGLTCAMGYEIAAQRVPGGEFLSLPAWEIHGEGIRQTAEGALLERGLYLVQLSCETRDAGVVLTLNGAQLRYLEALPTAGERRLNLQGLLSLRAPAVLRAMNNSPGEGSYQRAVMTLLRLQ